MSEGGQSSGFRSGPILFDVRISAPLVGLIVAYEGTLEPEPAD